MKPTKSIINLENSRIISPPYLVQKRNNNNKMERMNSDIRNREKTMRGLRKFDSLLLKLN
jgi:hypothetical protein